MPLNDTQVRNAKPGIKPRKLSDSHGLQLVVMPSGSRSWKLAYRFGGKQRELTIGAYPAVGLQAARQQRDECKRLLAAGIDPSHQKRMDRITKAASDAVTFNVVANELLEKKVQEGKAGATIGKRQWLYSLAAADLGSRPLNDVTAPEILHVLRKVEAKGHIETAHKLRSVIGEVFRYGVATGRATTDPTSALRGALIRKQVKHRAAILDAAELGGLLRAIEGFQGQLTTKAALKLLAMLFTRPGELRLAEWKEFDLAKAVWTIPAARMKMRREHRVPLPRQAIAVLEELRPYTGHSRLVFLGYGRNGKHSDITKPLESRPISENTLNAALRRMGYDSDTMTGHGFRASASTLLNESGKFSPDAIERAQSRQDSNAVRAIYARGEYWEERVRMMEWWADQLDAWRDGAKVLPFDRSA